MTIQPKIRARYQVRSLGKVKRTINFSRMDKETKSLQQEEKVVEEAMWMVYFPQGHSIRVNEKELRRLGYHLKPRMVDMNTGDVIDTGGDPYDLSGDITPGANIVLEDDLEAADNSARKSAKVN